MTVALRSPKLLGAMISVDNAPVDANLKSNFHAYAQGMREIEEAGIKKQGEADTILKKYEDVSFTEFYTYLESISDTSRLFPFDNFCSPTLFDRQMEENIVCVSQSRHYLQALIIWAISPLEIRTKLAMKGPH